jgi:hypothetical protein
MVGRISFVLVTLAALFSPSLAILVATGPFESADSVWDDARAVLLNWSVALSPQFLVLVFAFVFPRFGRTFAVVALTSLSVTFTLAWFYEVNLMFYLGVSAMILFAAAFVVTSRSAQL